MIKTDLNELCDKAEAVGVLKERNRIFDEVSRLEDYDWETLKEIIYDKSINL